MLLVGLLLLRATLHLRARAKLKGRYRVARGWYHYMYYHNTARARVPRTQVIWVRISRAVKNLTTLRTLSCSPALIQCPALTNEWSLTNWPHRMPIACARCIHNRVIATHFSTVWIKLSSMTSMLKWIIILCQVMTTVGKFSVRLWTPDGGEAEFELCFFIFFYF